MNRRTRKVVLAAAVICCMTVTGAVPAFAAEGVNVDSHSQTEIREMFKNLDAKHDFKLVFDEKPVTAGPDYRPGRLSEETLSGGIDMLNAMRYVAGIPYNVQLKEEYNQYCQAGALVNAVNGQMDHRPSKPSDMAQGLYQDGYKGCSSSNLHWGGGTLKSDVEGWISDLYNVSGTDPGHRRWCLNPTMEYSGFGAAGSYAAMYAFDNWNRPSAYTGVAWPAQQMPLEYFVPSELWSISFGRTLQESEIQVELTRQSDGHVWNFGKGMADGTFLVSNVGYGQKGCVVFRPENVKSFDVHEVFHVVVKERGAVIADYDVNFFKLRPSKASLKSVSTSKKHTITVKWSKLKCDGYQLRYSASKTFKTSKTVTIKDSKTVTKTLKSLKKGKTYYVKLRGYVLDENGKKIYGDYSAQKKIKCK